jgi:hypothetical protein
LNKSFGRNFFPAENADEAPSRILRGRCEAHLRKLFLLFETITNFFNSRSLLMDFVIHQSLLSFLPSWKTNVAEIRPLRCTAKSIKFYMCKGYLHKHELSVIHTYNRILCCTTDFFCFTTKVCVVTQNIVLCCTTDFFVLYAKYCVVDQILCCTTKFCVV